MHDLERYRKQYGWQIPGGWRAMDLYSPVREEAIAARFEAEIARLGIPMYKLSLIGDEPVSRIIEFLKGKEDLTFDCMFLCRIMDVCPAFNLVWVLTGSFQLCGQNHGELPEPSDPRSKGRIEAAHQRTRQKRKGGSR